MEQMTIEEVAKFLKVSRKTVFNLVKDGRLKKYQSAVGSGRGGRRVYFLRGEVEKLKRQIVRLS